MAHTITARAYDNAGMDLVRQVPGTMFNRQYWGSGAMGHSDKTVTWTVTNIGRPDVLRHPDNGRFGEAQSAAVLPVGERPMMKWNGNPYRLDGGDDGRTEEDGTFFLLPYWMGRYHWLIEE